MGKNLTQQKAGKGSTTYRSPSHRFGGSVALPKFNKEAINGTVKDIIHCPGHTSPLAEIKYENGEKNLTVAAEGIQVGEQVACGENVEIKIGNTLPLKSIPEGTIINSVELNPGDGGKLVKSSGAFAKVLAKAGRNITILLPSKKQRIVNENCRATIGIVAGSGRTEKPFLNAGRKFYAMRARNKYWPKVSGTAMNAVDHPYGCSRSSRKGRPTIAPRFAPPGRKVGMFKPKTTGRAK